MTRARALVGEMIAPARRGWQRQRRRWASRNALAGFARPLRLHIGCGKNYLNGWVNLDGNADLERVDVLWDLKHGLPCEDGSCALIYSEHVLEHLTAEQGVRLLRECRRVLQPGGVVRIAMPSLDVLIEKSANGNWKDQDWLRWPEYRFIQTRAEMLNVAFRWWDHQWLYDCEELHRRLNEAGFAAIEDPGWRESRHEGLRNLETRADSLLICEATKTPAGGEA